MAEVVVDMEVPAAEVGIKEIIEALDGMKLVLVAVMSVVKDGKVGVDDLKHLAELVTKYEVLVAAFDGAGQIGKEVVDMKLDELQVIAAKVVEVVAAAKAA